MRLISVVILILFFVNIIVAQQPKEFEKRIYTNEKGRIFINKALPLYFKISNSPMQGSKKYTLRMEDEHDNVQPIYLDKEGLNLLYSPSAVDTVTRKVIIPKQNVYFQVYADSKPPVSKLKNNISAHKKGGKVYFGKGLEVTISTNDKLSGVQKVFYSVDGAAFQEYKNPIPFNAEKEFTLKYYSVDNVGNVEKIKENKFTIDFSTPTSDLEIEGDKKDNIISPRSKIILLSNDAFTGIEGIYYSIDGKDFQKYYGPIKASSLKEGEHVLKYYSADLVGNKETEKSYVFFVDKTPPIVIDELLGDSYFANGKEYSSGRTKLKLSAIDNKAGVKQIFYSLDGKKYSEYETPFYLPNKKGNIKIDFYAVDHVNNKNDHGLGDGKYSKGKMFQSFIDLQGPSLSYSFNGATYKIQDTIYINANTKIKLTGKDSESGMKRITYSLDNKTEKTYSGNLNVSGNGKHRLDFFGYDNVNNSNQKNFSFKVDESSPDLKVVFSMAPLSIEDGIPVYARHLKIYISAEDNLVGTDNIYYSLNGSAYKLYTGFIRSLYPGKTYQLKIKAVDMLKNKSESEYEFKIN